MSSHLPLIESRSRRLVTQPSLIDIDFDDNEPSTEPDSQLAGRLHKQWNGYNDDTSQTGYCLQPMLVGCVANCMYYPSGKADPKNHPGIQ